MAKHRKAARVSEQQQEEHVEETVRRFHGGVVALFALKARSGVVSVAQIAARLGRTAPEIISWIESSNGWTVARVSDFCLAMGVEPRFLMRPVQEREPDVKTALVYVRALSALAKNGSSSLERGLIDQIILALAGAFDRDD